jgi:hypothetical protein
MPLDVPPADFAKTAINIIDSQEALAYHMAGMYANARGAQAVEGLLAQRDDAISDMANEWVRRGQTVRLTRQPYPSGGSGNVNGVLGGTSMVE